MGAPPILVLVKPEEGVRSPEVVDDEKLLGILDTITRFQVGETDSVHLSDTLDTFASIIRQIISGEDVTGSYVRYPVTNLQELAQDITDINVLVDSVNTVKLTASVPITTFQMIKLTGNNLMGLAKADISSNAKTLGCLIDTNKSIGEEGVVAISGRRIEGILTGATFGTKYYLDTAIDGAITPIITTNGVQLEIGTALNADDLLLDIKMPIIKK